MGMWSPWLALLAFLSLFHLALAQTEYNGVTYVTATGPDGDSVLVKDNRQPSLYTGNFGDCMGDSSINVTRFDAAFYKDNMTVLFHLTGDTSIVSEGLMSECVHDPPIVRDSDQYSVHCRLRLRRQPIRAHLQPLQRQYRQSLSRTK